ncbi:hypothetical protein TRFO_29346 [Tritrichomonas foetus]|uniref:Uncharacterized protein n=1 Tax=Tritrichomonas foetus TaxID=1144522 RepID=A0A1J4K0N6_9EUKA|nr:hypothetical protein TRFO_29346 [Tritrichomonas foetus]|eukprot:OHT03302.1 hypothetical protein TRFO_29346 [Tritrichomonas foetus]
MNMREMLQKSIKSQKFDDVSALSAQIEAVEKEEAMEAASRMQSDYRAADKKLHDLYKNELFAIDGNHDTKLATFQRQRLIAIKPLEQRVENLTRKKEEYLCTQKRLSTSSQFSTNSTMTPKSSLYSRNSPSSRMTPSSRCVRTARMASTSRNVPVFLNNPRLVIPNVSPIKRNNLSMTSPIKY